MVHVVRPSIYICVKLIWSFYFLEMTSEVGFVMYRMSHWYWEIFEAQFLAKQITNYKTPILKATGPNSSVNSQRRCLGLCKFRKIMTGKLEVDWPYSSLGLLSKLWYGIEHRHNQVKQFLCNIDFFICPVLIVSTKKILLFKTWRNESVVFKYKHLLSRYMNLRNKEMLYICIPIECIKNILSIFL